VGNSGLRVPQLAQILGLGRCDRPGLGGPAQRSALDALRLTRAGDSGNRPAARAWSGLLNPGEC
jgi:hypothetical protein